MKFYQVVCEDYKAHKFIVKYSSYDKKKAATYFKFYSKHDKDLTHKCYRFVVWK